MNKEAILEVMEEAIPPDELALWLDLPNLDLNGFTPHEALDADLFEEVIEAAWLKDPVGPVS
jgi:hypothetical protein